MDELWRKKTGVKASFCEEYQISSPIFERYFSDIPTFLQDLHLELELDYDAKDKVYRLKNVQI